MTSAVQHSFFVAPGGGDELNILGEVLSVKLRGRDTGGAYSVVVEETPVGGGVPLHVHHREDEGFYVLEGQYEFSVGDEIVMAETGSCLFAPRGIPHALRNVGDRPARLLVTISPPGFEGFFEEIDKGSRNGPMPLEQMADLARKYELEFLP